MRPVEQASVSLAGFDLAAAFFRNFWPRRRSMRRYEAMLLFHAPAAIASARSDSHGHAVETAMLEWAESTECFPPRFGESLSRAQSHHGMPEVDREKSLVASRQSFATSFGPGAC